MVKRKKKGEIEVKITHPIKQGNRTIEPGETITVQADMAKEWIQKGWAAAVAAEVPEYDDWENS